MAGEIPISVDLGRAETQASENLERLSLHLMGCGLQAISGLLGLLPMSVWFAPYVGLEEG